MIKIRQAAVAGQFYPHEIKTLQQMITSFLLDASNDASASSQDRCPKALIVPHAGYIFSGRVAASAYALLQPYRQTIKQVVLLGPAHFKAFSGLALMDVESFATPL